MRHGIAEDGQPGGKDSARALTAEGRKRLRAVLRRAKEAGVAPGLILSSPYVRALQTAEIAAKELGYSAEILRTRVLEPASQPEAAWEEIRLYKDHDQILLTGHEPLFGRLAAYLLGAPALEFDFKKGAIVRIDIEHPGPRPRGVLKWMLAPKLA
jgi:phosphohistidine phosphatase